MSDKTGSWHLDSDGNWIRHQFDSNGKALVNLQEQLMLEVQKKKKRAA